MQGVQPRSARLFAFCLAWTIGGPARAASSKFGAREWKKRLEELGMGAAWPLFEKNTSLLDFAFQKQTLLPTPPVAIGWRNFAGPRVLVIDDFLSPEECQFLRNWGTVGMAPAQVVGSRDDFYSTQAITRDNDQSWLSEKSERGVPLLRHVLKRMHRTARFPYEHAEGLQIGYYTVARKFEAHVDSNPETKVGRPATLLMYLNDVEQGGHTVFPVGRTDCSASWKIHPETGEQTYGAKYCCETPEKDAPETVRVRPKLGRAILFFSHAPSGEIDRKSEHIACPVEKGEKWISQRWFRFEPYLKVSHASGPSVDHRFDGLPDDGEEEPAGRHFRELSNVKPQLYLEHNFLNNEECDFLLALAAQPDQVRVGTVAAQLGQGQIDQDPRQRALADKAHLLGRLPPANMTNGISISLKIRSLSSGMEEGMHMYSEPSDTKPVTVLVFLTNVEEGGELIFPHAKPKVDGCGEDLGACCARAASRLSGLKLQPRRGDAVLIFNHGLDGELDSSAEHAHCPVAQGESWFAEYQFHFTINNQPKVETPHAVTGAPVVELHSMLINPTNVFFLDSSNGLQEISMGELPAKPGTLQVNSYHGHKFRVRDKAGVFVQDIVVRPGLGKQKHYIGGDQQDAEADTLSTPQFGPPVVEFQSMLSFTSEVFWVDFNSDASGAAEVSMGKLDPQPGTKQLTSSAGHTFRVRDEAGALLLEVEVRDGGEPQRHQVRAKVAGAGAIAQAKPEL